MLNQMRLSLKEEFNRNEEGTDGNRLNEKETASNSRCWYICKPRHAEHESAKSEDGRLGEGVVKGGYLPVEDRAVK